MTTTHYLTCFWPGLPELWWRGRLSGLPPAVGFTAILNLFLVSGWIYPQMVPSIVFYAGAIVGFVAWAVCVASNFRSLQGLIAPRKASDEPDHFADAHMAYLRGDWNHAEKLLTKVLAIEPRDPPALLMLCAVYRHQNRLDDAGLLIDEIARIEVADPWWIEVETERKRIRWAIARREESDENAEKTDKNPAADLTEARQSAA